MPQLTINLDSLLQEARRAVQRTPTQLQSSTAVDDGELINTIGEPLDISNTPHTALVYTSSDKGTDVQSPFSRIAEQQTAVQQLAELQQQYELKQQQVEVLQAQIQRLCSYVEAAVANDPTSSNSVSNQASQSYP